MRPVVVLGYGMMPVDEHWNLSLRELAGNAALSALENAGTPPIDAIFIGNMMSGTANHQQHLGSYLADWIGMPMVEAIRIEAACASGAATFRAGLMAVASGEADSVLVTAAEKMKFRLNWPLQRMQIGR
jgi:acetyl-CoA C-acetyltransferase